MTPTRQAPSLSGIRVYQLAYELDGIRATTLLEPFVAVGLVETQFLANGEPVAWTDRLLGFEQNATSTEVSALDLELGSEEDTADHTRTIDTVNRLQFCFDIERAFVMADGTCRYYGDTPAPRLLGR